MCSIEECVEHALAVLVYAEPPSWRSDWMYNNCIRSLGTFSTAFQQRENEIAILAPGSGKAFIKPPDPHKCATPVKAVRSRKLALREIRCIVFVIGRHTG